MGIQWGDNHEHYCTNPLTKTLSDCCTEGWRNHLPMAYRIGCGTIVPNDYQVSNRYSTAADWWDCKENLPMIALRLRSKWWLPRSSPPSPYQLQNHNIVRLGNGILKAAFQVLKHTPIVGCITTYCEACMLDMDQWYTTLADAIGSFYHPDMVSSKSHIWTDGYDDARGGSTHHSSTSQWDAIVMPFEI